MVGMSSEEKPVVFSINEDRLVGIIHAPAGTPGGAGVLVAVGGPQYRVGSHRQFLLMARFLASHRISTMRFDYCGMGDSEGLRVDFMNSFSEIRVAIDTFLENCSRIDKVVAWGLCDAASTIASHAHEDSRIAGLVLVNPWVRSEQSLAQTHVKHYYWRRLFSLEFIRKVISGRFEFIESIRSLINNIRLTVSGRAANAEGGTAEIDEQMVRGLQKFTGPVCIVLCGNDVTALEFEEKISGSQVWGRFLARPNVTVRRIANANHTFSRERWRKKVFEWTLSLVADV